MAGHEEPDAGSLTSASRSMLEQLPHQPVTDVRSERDPDVSIWEVLVPIQGLRARSARRLLVITAWEMVEHRPQLVTLRVAPRNRQREDSAG